MTASWRDKWKQKDRRDAIDGPAPAWVIDLLDQAAAEPMLTAGAKRIVGEFWHTMFNQVLDYVDDEEELRANLKSLRELGSLVGEGEYLTDEEIDDLVERHIRK